MDHTIAQPTATSAALASASRPSAYAADPPELELLRLALNHVDYGLVVLDVDNHLVQFANAPGRAALDDASDSRGPRRATTGLSLVQGRVTAARPGHAEQLRTTLARTKSGLRGLLNLGSDPQASAVAVLPLPHAARVVEGPAIRGTAQAPVSYALLVFAKQQLCDDSTMALFARERGLTNAEGQVLAQVCRGLRPAQIADRHGVRISTVRTQLRSIRMKTCCETIRELVQKVSVLPPMARHLSGHSPA